LAINEDREQLNDLEQFRFEIAIEETRLTDLSDRLGRTRWPLEPEGQPWEYGTSLKFLREIAQYWETQFDWRAIEARLNRHVHYSIPVDGLYYHLVIEHGSGSNSLPLVMFHGWPGSFIEHLQVARRIARPAEFGGDESQSRTVVIASLPGTGFSDPTPKPEGPREIAVYWQRLLVEHLGLSDFALHGSDWGAAISSWMAIDFPGHVRGIHLTSPILQPDVANLDPPLRAEEQEFLEARASRGPWEYAYQTIQGTKPLTLAYGLTDSPIGLAAWLLEKYHGWSSARDKDVSPPFQLDDLLTIVTLYWLAGPGPSTSIYRSQVEGTALRVPRGLRAGAPTWLCRFGDDVSPKMPHSWQERIYNVVHRTEIASGSHFPGLDATQDLADNLLKFLRSLAKG